MIPDTMAGLSLLTQVLKSILNNADDLDRASQKALTNLLAGITSTLASLIAGGNSLASKIVLDEVLKVAVSLVDVSNFQIHNSIPKDIPHERKYLDYDVDLESEGLLSFGDEAWTELSFRNNVAQQSQTASQASHMLLSLLRAQWKLIGPRLVADDPPIVTNTSVAVISMALMTLGQNRSLSMPIGHTGSKVVVPDLCLVVQRLGADCRTAVTVQVMATSNNLFSFMANATIPVPGDAGTVTLTVYNKTHNLPMRRLEVPFEVLLQRGPHFIPPEFSYMNPTENETFLPSSRKAVDNTEVYQALLVSETDVPDAQSGFTFQLKPKSFETCPQYLVVGRMLEPPIISQAGGKYDFWTLLPKNTKECGKYVAVSTRIFCKYIHGDMYNLYSIPLNKVSPLTTIKRTHCLCYKASTFASGWLALPNFLSFDYVFRNMDFTKNVTLYAAEITVGALFVLIFIWARRTDLKDVEKLRVTPLAQNNPDDEYLYELFVSTGHRHGAGTDSRVCIQLSGEYEETRPTALMDPCRKVLQRGNCDRFLLACPRYLGRLIYCRLWHDNSGIDDRASWYCSYVGVLDLQTGKKSHFVVGRWLGVEEDDGQVRLCIPAY
ncbi:unnamed protein product [Dicrocoelium dendriticum]|nr:unnamed protein product [Dicrocoelium dendriticum]